MATQVINLPPRSATPAGQNKAVQFNNNGAFGADSSTFFDYDLATHSLSVSGLGVNLGRPPNYVMEVVGASRFASSLRINYNGPNTACPLRLEYGLSGQDVDGIQLYNTFSSTPTTSIGFWNTPSGTGHVAHSQIQSVVSNLGADSTGNLRFKTALNDSLTTKQEIFADGRVAFNVADPGGTVHANGVNTVVENPANFNVVLALAPPEVDVSSPSAFQSAGHLDAPLTPAAVPNYMGSGFIADGSTYDYQFRSFDGSAWSAPFTSANFTDDNSSNPFSVDLTWSVPGQGSPTVYGIGRSINSGSYVWQYVDAMFTNYTDDNTGFVDTAPSTFYPDFVANGSTWNFSAIVGVFTSPSGSTVYSPNPQSAGFTDTGSNISFTITLTSSGPTTVKWIPDFTSGSFIGDTTAPISVGTDVFTQDTNTSPSNYGILSDGSALTRTFALAEFISYLGMNVYSSGLLTGTTNDPNDGLYYYWQLSWNPGSPGSHSFKVVDESLSVALITSSQSVNYDALSSWSDPAVLSPNSLNLPGVIAQNSAGAFNNPAPLVVIGGPDYSRIDFLNDANSRVASIEASSGATTFRSQNSTVQFQITNTGVGFFGQTPAGTQTGGSATAGALYTATEQAMLQKAYDCLRTFGFLT